MLWYTLTMNFRKEWFNDENFWKYYAPIIFDDKRWSEVGEVADAVTRLAGLTLNEGKPSSENNANPRALDLCCGMGRISAELSRRGFSTTGVDLSPSLLETAKEDAAHENLDIEYVLSDARLYKRPQFFDTAVCLYISFGYFENPADDLLVAKNVYESLKSGGSFIIETLGKEIAARDFTPGESFERAGYTVLTEYEVVNSWSALKNRWVLIPQDPKDLHELAEQNELLELRDPLERHDLAEYGGAKCGGTKCGGAKRGGAKCGGAIIEKIFMQRLYAASELKELLLEAGFSTVEIYGGWDESAYDQNAESLIAVGRRK